uniref:Uncharacterized protein n=1 Tax=uncultured euryarchaeote Alv-FOS4 TaxID=337893 RepID=Q3SA97_9EURY|nr:hypothetical protein [uncultured euryarchaeote Alv-FOS4]
MREAEKNGIAEDSIGKIDIHGKRGTMKVHYRHADKIAKIPLFEEFKIQRGS